jgi:hypothetical protein
MPMPMDHWNYNMDHIVFDERDYLFVILYSCHLFRLTRLSGLL